MNFNSQKSLIGIIGLGFVGSAINKSFIIHEITTSCYDKFKNIGSFEDILDTEILFLCLPTQYSSETKSYDLSSIIEICNKLKENLYTGLVVIKSTVEIGTINNLEEQFSLSFIHNPEFLTSRTAFEDFHNQKHIVLGRGNNVNDFQFNNLCDFYSKYYPNAKISHCSTTESESMKLFCNSFYSVKIQFFNELYFLCNKLNIDFNNVKDLMLKNNWINPMHTNVPGPDGQISYGGLCFPKDTNALNQLMIKLETPNSVLDSVIKERDIMRSDNENCK